MNSLISGERGVSDREWMERAIELSLRCSRSSRAFSVGAILVDHAGGEIARGYSREAGPVTHAEEVALGKVTPGDPRLEGATLYSTLEPCSARASSPVTCTQLIIAARVPRVVIAWHEPSTFVPDCQGYERLLAAGVEVVVLPELAELARMVNAHLLGPMGVASGTSGHTPPSGTHRA